MNPILIACLITLFLSWLLAKVYHRGYRTGWNDSVNTHLDGQTALEYRARMLENRLAATEPSPGEDIHVLDYSQYPPTVTTGVCITYDKSTNHVTFKRRGDIFPLTGKYHDGIMVFLDYCQEC